MATPTAPRVQNFKVLKLLGKGSYGKVYKVQRATDDQFYALKETDLGTMDHTERMDAVNEIRLLVSINHPNVIGYNEAFLNGNKLCVIMEYAPYGDLRYYIAKGLRTKVFFPEEAVWRLFLQLARGLAALHTNQVVHRDIKPANIFLCANDLLKIGDLGVAKALTRTQFTSTQIGTPCYMAPEVWSGRPYSYSSDLWSLGCVLYEMMTFRTPMEGRSMQELKLRICSGRFATIPPGRYSAELTGFAHSLLSLDPRKRPTAEQVLNNPTSAKWLHVMPSIPSLPASKDNGVTSPLMSTIHVPRDLRQLSKVLPPAVYASDIRTANDQAARPQAAPSRSRMSDPGNMARPVLSSRNPPPALNLHAIASASGAPSPNYVMSRPGSAVLPGARARSPALVRMPSPMAPPPYSAQAARPSYGSRPASPSYGAGIAPAPRSHGSRPASPSYGGIARAMHQGGGQALPAARHASYLNIPERIAAGSNPMLPPIAGRPSGGAQQGAGGLLQAPMPRPARRITYS
mmetsp:Transcript_909/g.1359  ORF Transcript_909/g.1359 Transcript_909/m.1359 type:complete len:516 (+) Transcript_909:145-1692(+)|eukprot:CAMPEP_0119105266 /NCGR_PEP_ID=MMETSP1180-20130426/3280_1 /TAXON_ID=3052 ORGANISM="Chlamydomonas cf sp, Strain CCMP681" /NCGR_SAMPLE_ID=MMETSP1180 /ASSEMBLY_ACC=CAM_ASM_000741 /LENGTH=515 /DNA_ID=CAMNT_0007090275 /DNA_START=139 /DNA_END=1686 /DNA_ORIENTATION=+